MSKIAYVFPGQGSQNVGMGKDVANQFSEANEMFKQADQTLGYSLSSLCFEGPEEELKVTYHTQPALLTTSIALYESAKKWLPKAEFVAGHSLGEYSALVVAGVLSFSDAVDIVSKRGTFMNEAVPSGVGAMAAVLGTERSLIQEVCDIVTKDGNSVQMANINCPGQIVISGVKEGVEKASVLLKEKGTKRVMELPVSGPFHSSLMKPASEKLELVLNSAAFHDALIPVVTNVEATETKNKENIKNLLVSQVYSSVLWEDSIRYMIDNGVDTFIEIGAGKVLSGLIKKIDRNVKIYNLQDVESLNQLKEEFTGVEK